MYPNARVQRARRAKRDLQAAAVRSWAGRISPPWHVGAATPLETKLHAPAVRREWVHRAELVHQLARTRAKLILIDAPAGFGKTTLVAQWQAQAGRSRRFAWVSLDGGDNDEVRLWQHILSTLRRSSPDLAVGEPGWPLPASREALPGAVLRRLVNRLARTSTPVVLVLDDYHVIKERGCHEQLKFLVAHLPPLAQIVLITRADPPLPLARLRARGELAELRARDLRFSPAEAAALVRTTAGIQLGEADLADLVARTEGWAAGLYLAALSLRGHPSPGAFIHQFSGNNRFVFDFLTEEALNLQPPEIRRFLMRTSILDRLTAPLCDEVAGTSNAAEILAGLDRANLFVVALDDGQVWYRYHHLFAQMLRSRLARAEPGMIADLHRRASAWHRDNGLAEEAVSHALAARDFSAAVGILAKSWAELVFAGRTATVSRWIRALGDERILADPLAAHCAAWVSALTGDQEAFRRCLAVIEVAQQEGPLPDGMRSLRASAALVRATFGFGGLPDMRAAADAAVKLQDVQAGCSTWHALARTVRGYGLYLCGEPGAAAELAEALLCQAVAPLVRMLALGVAALIACEEGRLRQAEELASAGREIALRNGLAETQSCSFVYTAAGAIHYHGARLAQARGEFEQALRVRRGWLTLSPWPTVDIFTRLAGVQADAGDPAGAAISIAEARSLLAARPDGAEALYARVNAAERLLRRGWSRRSLSEPLTEREQAVLRMLRGPLSVPEIGRELHVSPNTVKTHTRAIYRKLGVSTRHDAVRRARQQGMVI
jgi:LuxR family maltose regulon positive regulatory protein